MKQSLSYRDERDRCYGATGMAIGIVVMDGEDYLERIDIDAPSDRMVDYSADFLFSGNPSVSAKQSWNRTLQAFHYSVISMLSNMLCRTIVLDGTPVRSEVKQLLHDLVVEEGLEALSLEADEADRLFSKDYDYLFRVFNHRGVQSVAHDFASTLAECRSMSRLEVLEKLKALSMI